MSSMIMKEWIPFLIKLIYPCFFGILIYIYRMQIKEILNELINKLKNINSIKINDVIINIDNKMMIDDSVFSESLRQHLAFSNDSTINLIEDTIINNLKSKNFNIKDGVNFLIRQLSSSHMISTFLYFDAHFFFHKEQLAMLSKLNTSLNDNQYIDNCYKQFKERIKEDTTGKQKKYENWSIDDFTKFPLEQGLIIKDKDIYTISLLAKDYLASRTKRNLYI